MPDQIVIIGDYEVGYVDEDGIVLYMNDEDHIVGELIKD